MYNNNDKDNNNNKNNNNNNNINNNNGLLTAFPWVKWLYICYPNIKLDITIKLTKKNAINQNYL